MYCLFLRIIVKILLEITILDCSPLPVSLYLSERWGRQSVISIRLRSTGIFHKGNRFTTHTGIFSAMKHGNRYMGISLCRHNSNVPELNEEIDNQQNKCYAFSSKINVHPAAASFTKAYTLILLDCQQNYPYKCH